MLELVLVLKLNPATWSCRHWLTDGEITAAPLWNRAIVNVNVISNTCAFSAWTQSLLLEWCENWTRVSSVLIVTFSGKTTRPDPSSWFPSTHLMSKLKGIFLATFPQRWLFAYSHHSSHHNCSFSVPVLSLRGCNEGCITPAGGRMIGTLLHNLHTDMLWELHNVSRGRDIFIRTKEDIHVYYFRAVS